MKIILLLINKIVTSFVGAFILARNVFALFMRHKRMYETKTDRMFDGVGIVANSLLHQIKVSRLIDIHFFANCG